MCSAHDQARAESGKTAMVRLATLPDDGPNGSFFEDAGLVPW